MDGKKKKGKEPLVIYALIVLYSAKTRALNMMYSFDNLFSFKFLERHIQFSVTKNRTIVIRIDAGR